MTVANAGAEVPQATGTLRRVLTLWDLIIIGIVIVQPIAPMGIYGVISNEARGHVVTTILIAMVAMLFTAISYGKMARAYPVSYTHLDVYKRQSQSKANVLAVETIAQKETDLGINWVDWNPAPPDKDMGLWRDVYLRPSGPVTIRYPQVITHFPAARCV